MKSYGRKIIDYIFKRWAERPAICYEPERKVQADSDRSDIRVSLFLVPSFTLIASDVNRR